MTSGFARTALALSLALASGAACALGLGQIEVKSRAGQPLLAEIPVVSSDREELAQLRAGLASPETFQRIGLQPPQGIVTDLRFTLALDAAGKPVIRVTSSQPVTQPLLTFLIEVDWGQGRLTREYSALIDTPRTAAAPMQPPIQAPTGAASNTIERPLDAPLPFGAQPQQTDPLAVENQLGAQDPNLIGAAPPSPLPAAPEPIAMQPEPAPMPAPARANAGTIERPAARPPAPAVDAEGGVTVARGQTLSGIAADLAGGHSLDQTMIALLRANPEAFIGGNINRLRQGAVLRLPADGVAAIDPREASELVRAQVQQWRQARQPVPQPIGLEADAAVAKAPVAPAAQNAARGGDARLEIVPPGASRATQAGTQSGLSAGGEGNMMRQEIQQANETLAAREAELAELKSRVAELEKLQKDQQKLIALKDSELASTQQRLAEQQARSDGGSPLPWLFGGLGVLALLIGGWVLSRREPKRPSFRAPPADAPASSRPSSAAAAAAATQPAAGDALRRRPEPAAETELVDPVAQLLGEVPAERRGDHRADPVPTQPPVAADPGQATAPFWTSPRQEPQSAPQQRVPTWHAAEAGSARSAAPLPRSEPKLERPASAADTPAPAATGPIQQDAPAAVPAEAAVAPGQERIELARAYLDLGDEGSARQLLGEVLINGDHAARQQAARMLRELEASSG
ncbi:FimV/HubP family polar landmark protein [Lysobacter firmicutimachus]|uniref:FimV/HubP family polar landmark protein n=1 Tax=Lysobacter firmicutimachus TaxID=1792846 RepID=A0AAU8MR99_9GAMM